MVQGRVNLQIEAGEIPRSLTFKKPFVSPYQGLLELWLTHSSSDQTSSAVHLPINCLLCYNYAVSRNTALLSFYFPYERMKRQLQSNSYEEYKIFTISSPKLFNRFLIEGGCSSRRARETLSYMKSEWHRHITRVSWVKKTMPKNFKIID